MQDNKTAPQIQDAIYAALRGFYLEDFNTFCPPGIVGPVRECVEAQVAIGWVGFVEGLLTPKWAQLQEEYFRSLGFRRTGQRWAVNLSKQIWKLIFAMWDHQNSILFTKNKVDELSGLDKLKQAIIREKSLGIGDMHPSLLPYLNLPQSSFSRMKPIDLQRWFFLIRQAREEKGYEYDDDFAKSKSLRNWVGLPDPPSSQSSRTPRSKRKKHNRLCFTRSGYYD